MTGPVVAKFGGSSLADAERFTAVKAIVEEDPARAYVVVSAPGKRASDDHKVTDLLYMSQQLASHHIDASEVFALVEERYLSIAQELGLNVDIKTELQEIKKDIDGGATAQYVASRGEYLNALLLAEYLGYQFVDAGTIIRFRPDGTYDEQATLRQMRHVLQEIPQAVIPGFYGADEDGQVHTFSRGGSDITGAIVARAMRASLYENWTDVSGFLQADPSVVDDPDPIETVTYKELRELSYMGAAVLHEEAIFPVRQKRIPIHVRNTTKPGDPGTLIVDDQTQHGFTGITGVAGMQDFTVITLDKTMMDEEKGFLRKLVSVFETNGVSISHVPSGIDSVSVVVRTEAIRFKMKKILAELDIYCHPDSIKVEEGISLIAVVGKGMIRTAGVAGRVFTALAEANVNVRIITQGASELSIVIGVEDEQFAAAVQALHAAI